MCLGGGGDDALQPKGGGGGVWGKSIATGLGREPVGGCYSAEMRRPAIRSTAHDPILSYPTYQPPIQDVSLQISVPNCVTLRGYTIKMAPYQYRKSHCGDKTISRSFNFHNGISYTGNRTSLYWIGALLPNEKYEYELFIACSIVAEDQQTWWLNI